jgi:hypothetical protein
MAGRREVANGQGAWSPTDDQLARGFTGFGDGPLSAPLEVSESPHEAGKRRVKQLYSGAERLETTPSGGNIRHQSEGARNLLDLC